MTPSYCREQRRGLSTFEFQIRLHEPVGSGDRIVVDGTLGHAGRSSLQFVHRMRNEDTGAILAELIQMAVHLDKDARRPTAMPGSMIDAARALVGSG